MERRRKGYGDEKSLPFWSLAGFRAAQSGREKRIWMGCWNPKLLLLGTSWCVLEQERIFVFAEQPEHARYIWALRRPCLPELRLTEMKQLRSKSQSLGDTQRWDSIQVRNDSKASTVFLSGFSMGAPLTFCVGFFPHTGQEVQLANSKLSHSSNQKLFSAFLTSPLPPEDYIGLLAENHNTTLTKPGAFLSPQDRTQSSDE